jgi:hypothetical protein
MSDPPQTPPLRSPDEQQTPGFTLTDPNLPPSTTSPTTNLMAPPAPCELTMADYIREQLNASPSPLPKRQRQTPRTDIQPVTNPTVPELSRDIPASIIPGTTVAMLSPSSPAFDSLPAYRSELMEEYTRQMTTASSSANSPPQLPAYRGELMEECTQQMTAALASANSQLNQTIASLQPNFQSMAPPPRPSSQRPHRFTSNANTTDTLRVPPRSARNPPPSAVRAQTASVAPNPVVDAFSPEMESRRLPAPVPQTAASVACKTSVSAEMATLEPSSGITRKSPTPSYQLH